MGLSVDMTKCRCMHVKQVQKFSKLKENEACEESHHKGDRWCKNGKTHATLGKGNL